MTTNPSEHREALARIIDVGAFRTPMGPSNEAQDYFEARRREYALSQADRILAYLAAQQEREVVVQTVMGALDKEGLVDPDWGDARACAERIADALTPTGSGEGRNQGADAPVEEVLITPGNLQDLIGAAYIAGATAVHEHYQPDPDPDFKEAAWDYVAGLDFTTTTRPSRARFPLKGKE